MNKFTTNVMVVLFILLFSNVTHAATSEVTWTDYKKYRDIHPSNESRKHFRERTFYNFEKHFSKLANRLPEGQVLKIDVTDVDLAGDTHAGGISSIRIVKDIYFPRLHFFYQLFDVEGSVIESNNVMLKDINFMASSRLKYRRDSIGYEKKMLDEWFFEVFKDRFIQKEKL